MYPDKFEYSSSVLEEVAQYIKERPNTRVEIEVEGTITFSFVTNDVLLMFEEYICECGCFCEVIQQRVNARLLSENFDMRVIQRWVGIANATFERLQNITSFRTIVPNVELSLFSAVTSFTLSEVVFVDETVTFFQTALGNVTTNAKMLNFVSKDNSHRVVFVILIVFVLCAIVLRIFLHTPKESRKGATKQGNRIFI